MRYLGGKFRQGKVLAQIIAPHLQPNGTYIEPFCGSLWAAIQVIKKAPWGLNVRLSDSNEALITMWRALLDGWKPPSVVTEREYNVYKYTQDPLDPKTAFIGFGCAFAAKWYNGFARNNSGVNYAKQSVESCAKKMAVLWDAEKHNGTHLDIEYADYRSYENQLNSVMYLDPPYAGRATQTDEPFDSEKFWDFARKVSKKNKVFVTEFIAPADFVPIHSFGDTVVRHYAGKGTDGTQECVFVHKSQAK